ncbi:actinin alpha 2 [Gryganskiella cystojenkinii]|nr:actinin alpha 2 [Gryganskiella cystojenkinii]
MVRQFAASQIDTQKTAFMRWVNVQLAKTTTYVPMATIEKDLRDGKRLIGLLEVISNEPLKPERGNMRIHQMANVSKALSFLEKKTDEPLGSIGNEDIVDGNVKLTLGLIWIIIYRFQIQHVANTMTEFYPSLLEEMNQQVDAKQALLRWVRNQLEDYSDVIPPIQDFHRSWRTGLAFAALIHRHDQTFLPEFYSTILQAPYETIEQWRNTLTLAFDTAFEKMNLPKLLDPEDLVDVETPDERSIMTYVSEYYLVMSKHEREQDPALTEQQHALRAQAKEQRQTVAGEDQQEALRRIQEEDDRKKRDEQEELERIRLKRLEIEGWSVRAAERAREEEEARRKRREEEEEKSRQRQLRREQRERERAQLLQEKYGPTGGGKYSKSAIDTTEDILLAESELGRSTSAAEPMDPEELSRRQGELEEKLALYKEQSSAFSEWIQQQQDEFPQTPDIATPLDGSDLESFTTTIKTAEAEWAVRESKLMRIHGAREELLDYELPELSAEQVAEVDKIWWDIDSNWNALHKKSTDAKIAVQELEWVIGCSQEMDRIMEDVHKFEVQLQAAATKRAQDSLDSRSQPSLLDFQDSNLFSMKMLLKKYTETLSSLLESTSHSPPQHLSERNTDLIQERLPQVATDLEVAQQSLSTDRSLRTFLSAYELAADVIEKALEWLTAQENPSFVSEDVWKGAETVKEYVSRDTNTDINLEPLEQELTSFKSHLEEEQRQLTEFRANGLVKLGDDCKVVLDNLERTNDITASATTIAVQEKVKDVTDKVERVEELLPKETHRYTYATRVLDYLVSARSTLSQLEAAYATVLNWTSSQPELDVESAVLKVEAGLAQLESAFKSHDQEPFVWESIQIRHAGLSTLVRDLRTGFQEKQLTLKDDQQLKEFLELTQTCQTTLRDFRAQLYDKTPFSGFAQEDTTPQENFAAMVVRVRHAFEAFETGMYSTFEILAAAVSEALTRPGFKQDPTLIQNKITSVQRLLKDIRALQQDRERDVKTLKECRRVASHLVGLNSTLEDVEAKLASIELTEGDQSVALSELADRFNHTTNEIAGSEQETIYRFLVQDPSCTVMLREIRDRQSNIRQMQSRLLSGLEVGQQWSILWDQYSDMITSMEQSLQEAEQEIVGRGISTMNGLADGEENWKKTEDELHEAEDENNKSLTSLKQFQKARMVELASLKTSLHQSMQQSGGIESVDQYRRDQYHEAEKLQSQIRAHVQRLLLMVSQEGFQLEILGQRLVWSQQLSGSKAEVNSSTISCQAFILEYATLLKKCSEHSDTSMFTTKTAEGLKKQANQIASSAASQKETTFDVTLAIYQSLSELATVAAPGETTTEPKTVPLHLEVELYEFKNQYTLLDLHLAHVHATAEHAASVGSFLRNVDVMDSGFLRMVTELKAEKEATSHTLEKLDAIRIELEDLTTESRSLTKVPKAGDKIQDIYVTLQQQTRADLEKMVNLRLDHSRTLSAALNPFLLEFKALLAYQVGLRQLAEEMNEHEKWITKSGRIVQSVQDQVKQMFSSWPGDELEQRRTQAYESMVVFDVDEQIVVDDLDVLMADMDKEFAHVQAQKPHFQESRRRVELALESATVHSKQLQLELEWTVDQLAIKIQRLETDIRTKSLQLQALERRAIWEKEIEVARSWFKDFAKAVILFAREQSKWKASHHHRREFDDAASMRSYRTTASRLQIDRLGLSVIEFEDQVEIFETESRPRVDKAWQELCSALVFIARAVPDEFQRRQTALGREFEEIRKQVAHSAHIVTQRKSLEDVAFRLEELDGYKEELRNSGMSIKSGRYGPETTGAVPVVTKTTNKVEKGWNRFQAKVKKLARK